MWELRLILILIGVVFIAAVYLFSRQKKQSTADVRRKAPSFVESDLPEPSIVPAPISPPPSAVVPATATELEKVNGDLRRDDKQLILSLHVACRHRTGFGGADVLTALQASGLQYGHYRVFHRLFKDDAEKSVFSVANMIEPGVLEPESLSQIRIPGLTLFLLLPGPQESVMACADMLATARTLARLLGGDVLDEQHVPLTLEGAQQIRERILEFQRRVNAPSSQ